RGEALAPRNGRKGDAPESRIESPGRVQCRPLSDVSSTCRADPHACADAGTSSTGRRGWAHQVASFSEPPRPPQGEGRGAMPESALDWADQLSRLLDRAPSAEALAAQDDAALIDLIAATERAKGR